jgi:hypothetical protein
MSRQTTGRPTRRSTHVKRRKKAATQLRYGRPVARRYQDRTVDLSAELDDLDLPMVLPGEARPAVDRGGYEPTYFDRDGHPIQGASFDDVMRKLRAISETDGIRVAQTTLYRRGVRLWVSTVWLHGIDHGFADGPAVLWETMVFQSGRASECQWRYASPDAALAGHRQVVAHITAGAARNQLPLRRMRAWVPPMKVNRAHGNVWVDERRRKHLAGLIRRLHGKPAWGEYAITGTGQVLTIHTRAACVGPCAFHKPSRHPLRTAPIHWRGHVVERICSHGVGHPDPDDLTWREHENPGESPGIHGCDGCCARGRRR